MADQDQGGSRRQEEREVQDVGEGRQRPRERGCDSRKSNVCLGEGEVGEAGATSVEEEEDVGSEGREKKI